MLSREANFGDQDERYKHVDLSYTDAINQVLDDRLEAERFIQAVDSLTEGDVARVRVEKGDPQRQRRCNE